MKLPGAMIELSASGEETRPMLTYPWLDAETGTLIAADGFKLAVIELEDVSGECVTGPIPTQALKEARKAPKSRAGWNEIVGMSSGSVTVTTKVGKLNMPRYFDQYFKEHAQFPDYTQITRDNDPDPKTTWPTIVVDARQLYDLARSICPIPGKHDPLAVAIYASASRNGPIHVKACETPDGARSRPYGMLMPMHNGEIIPDKDVPHPLDVLKKLRGELHEAIYSEANPMKRELNIRGNFLHDLAVVLGIEYPEEENVDKAAEVSE